MFSNQPTTSTPAFGFGSQQANTNTGAFGQQSGNTFGFGTSQPATAFGNANTQQPQQSTGFGFAE
ncbi:hypothetical protein RMATCC62417_09552 [Rhizopus microsporus]|nr:hypothetical protein RMATCC62417_09552 [Rhizopus microsporus]